ncbi:hypothetical protein PNOK_0646800 [Pyrrhoderma noxium]|uniref:DUF6533 domain-containing protein n=1 Tax=Pyrrhoderma noxium TaxID=2282107 RepID=A0A286UED5_9AGAM|nr:hypothetical protein PNOK_0646800 [Pyrrhoderma noxium]
MTEINRHVRHQRTVLDLYASKTDACLHFLYLSAISIDLAAMLFSLLFKPGHNHVPQDDVIPFVQGMTITQLVQFSVATLLIYDIVITVDMEVSIHVHPRSKLHRNLYDKKRPFQFIKVVYFLNRYLGLFGSLAYLKWGAFNPTESQCKGSDYRWSLNLTNCVIIISIDYILMKRVLALYLQGRQIERVLKSLLVLASLIKIILFAYIQSKIPVLVGVLAEGTTVCGESGPQPPLYLYIFDWGFPLLFEGVLMVLAFFKASLYWKRSTSFGAFLVKVLIRDQFIYLLLATFCSVLSIIENNIPISNKFISAVFLVIGNPSILCVLGSRMLFNLKESRSFSNESQSDYESYQRRQEMQTQPRKVNGNGMNGLTSCSFHDARGDIELRDLPREDCMMALREMQGSDNLRCTVYSPELRFGSPTFVESP